MASEKKRLQRAIDWIDDFGRELVQSIVSVFILLSTVLLSDEAMKLVVRRTGLPVVWADSIQAGSFVFLIVLSPVCVLLTISGFSKAKRVSTLAVSLAEAESKNELLVENVRNLLEGYLLNFGMYKLKFGSQPTNNERVSIYVHDKVAKGFVPAGRYSPNPEYKRTGRDLYPDNEGCIATAWRDGWHCPAPLCDPTRKKASYLKEQTQLGIPERTVEGFRMPSRFYCGCRIDGHDATPLAVLIVESTEPERFTEDELKTAVQDEVVRYLSDLVSRVRPHLATPSAASKMGF